MTSKEAYSEVKSFKDLYRAISKLGDFYVIRGKLYFDFLDNRDFFLTTGKLTTETEFSKFVQNHVFLVHFDDIKTLRDAKKKDVLDVVVEENSLTYKLQDENGPFDIVFRHDETLVRDGHSAELIVIDDILKPIHDDFHISDIIEIYEGDIKILEVPTKSLVIVNTKNTELVRYRYSKLVTTEGNVVEVESRNPMIDLQVRMLTL